MCRQSPPNTLQSVPFAKSVIGCAQENPHWPDEQTMATKGRNGKSGNTEAHTIDGHVRSKDFLTDAEMDALLEAAKKGRHGIRDHVLLLMIYRHGLRVAEAATFQLDALEPEGSSNLGEARQGLAGWAQPITGHELRAIKRYLAVRKSNQPWLFITERDQQFTCQGIAYIIREAGKRSSLGHVAAHAAPLLRLPPGEP